MPSYGIRVGFGIELTLANGKRGDEIDRTGTIINYKYLQHSIPAKCIISIFQSHKRLKYIFLMRYILHTAESQQKLCPCKLYLRTLYPRNISQTNYLLINHLICTTPDTE